jgi:branched-chain amino acid transport system permease protein
VADLLKRQWLVGLLLIIGVLLPYVVPNQYYLYVTALGFIWTIAVYGLNLITGYTGQLNLAHAGFFAIGAYGVGILTKGGMSFWPALLIACLLTMVIGLFVGLIALRLKEHYFAIFTLCVGFIIYLIIEKWDSLTGGVVGLIGVPYPNPIGPITFENNPVALYYLVLFFLLLTIFIFTRIVNSIVGRTFMAIKNSEELAQTLGIHLMKNKVLAFVLSTFFAGLAGGLYAVYIRFLGAEIGNIVVTFDILMYLLVGGIGTIGGPVLGTLLVTWVTQYLNAWSEFRMIIFGPLLILIVIFFPRGIVGAFKVWQANRKMKKMKANKKESARRNERAEDVS